MSSKDYNLKPYQKEANFSYPQDEVQYWKKVYDFSLDGEQHYVTALKNPRKIIGTQKNRLIAEEFGRKVAKEYGHDPNNTDFSYLDEGDAARHALFSALNTQIYGREYAQKVGDAIERSGGESSKSRSMDLRNNMFGYMTGIHFRDATVDELKGKVREGLEKGFLKVLKKGFKQ